MSEDRRPRLAVGHVNLEVDDVGDAYAFFVRHGMRDIFKGEEFGVLELRGGTHLVLNRANSDDRVRPKSFRSTSWSTTSTTRTRSSRAPE